MIALLSAALLIGASVARAGSPPPPAVVPLPYVLYSSGGVRWDVTRSGAIGRGTDHAFDGGYRLRVNGLPFPASFTMATAEDYARELAIGPATMGSLRVTRKVYVGTADAFVRYVEILENPTLQPVQARVDIDTNLGAVTGTEFVDSSESDGRVDLRDDFIYVDDADGTGSPVVCHIFSGPGARVEPSAVFTDAPGGDHISVTFDVSVPPGERVLLMHFGVQDEVRRFTVLYLRQVDELPRETLAGLSADELAHIVNFAALPAEHPVADRDEDGLPDKMEKKLGTNPGSADTDLDNMPDLYEVQNGFDPLNPADAGLDADGDGLSNVQERFIGSDPRNADTDGDGLSDWEESYSTWTNPNSADTDGDGLSDPDELQRHTSPRSADTDNDALPDPLEIFSLGTDPRNDNTDGGDRRDGEEALVDGTNPLVAGDDLPIRILPFTLTGSDGAVWDIKASGWIGEGAGQAFDKGLRLSLGNATYFYLNSGGLGNGGRELGMDTYGEGFLQARKVYVPPDDTFIRVLDIFWNLGQTDRTYWYQISSDLRSDALTEVVSTSSGDTLVDARDRFVVTDDADGSGTPAILHAFAGAGAQVEPSAVSLDGDKFSFAFALRIPAGKRVIVMHFASQSPGRAHALSLAEALRHPSGAALAGMSAEELADVVNYAVFPDADGDGLSDAEESALGTDAGNPDSDGDGLLDGFEAHGGLDPLVAGDTMGDPDGDGLDNLAEQAAGSNPNLADTDGDGLDDGAEVMRGTDPAHPDSDRDGLSDGEEVLVDGSDPLLRDTDGDGVPDEEEVRVHGSDPSNPDSDGDGLRDGFEADNRFDLLAPGDDTRDPDGDGLDNLGEQTAGSLPLVPDTDGDSLTDGEEVHQFGTDPTLQDTDGGGRRDSEEVFVDGTDPLVPGDDRPATPLPATLTDDNGFLWDIQPNGTILHGTNNAFNGGLRVNVRSGDFPPFSEAAIEDGGREWVLGPYRFADGFRVVRKVFVPTDDAFVRYLEILDNPAPTDRVVPVEIRSWLGAGTSTRLRATSDGDTVFETTDDYLITDNYQQPSSPTLVHAYSGPNALIEPYYVDRFFPDLIRIQYNVTVPAHGRAILMHFASQNASLPIALAGADNLRALRGSALDGLSAEEQAQIVNFFAYEDADLDGLSDEEEAIIGTDPNDPDTDHDGLLDGAEVKRYGSSPFLVDTDGDGFQDATEVEFGTNPTLQDSDGDGIPDPRDVEFVENAAAGFPQGAFRKEPKDRLKVIGLFEKGVEPAILRGRIYSAIDGLLKIEQLTNGCGAAPDKSDVVIDCGAQAILRDRIAILRGNL